MLHACHFPYCLSFESEPYHLEKDLQWVVLVPNEKFLTYMTLMEALSLESFFLKIFFPSLGILDLDVLPLSVLIRLLFNNQEFS